MMFSFSFLVISSPDTGFLFLFLGIACSFMAPPARRLVED